MADTKKVLVVQDDFTNWVQSCTMKTKQTSETMLCLHRCLPPSQKPHGISLPIRKSSSEVVKISVSLLQDILAAGVVNCSTPSKTTGSFPIFLFDSAWRKLYRIPFVMRQNSPILLSLTPLESVRLLHSVLLRLVPCVVSLVN